MTAAALLYSTCRHFFREICGFENRWAILKMTEQILFLLNRLHENRARPRAVIQNRKKQNNLKALASHKEVCSLSQSKACGRGSPCITKKRMFTSLLGYTSPKYHKLAVQRVQCGFTGRNYCEPLYYRKIHTQLLLFRVGFCNPSSCSSTWWSSV